MLRLVRNTLWAAVVERTEHASAAGALAPTDTTEDTLEDAGVRFIVRCALSHEREADPGPPERGQPSSQDKKFALDSRLLVTEISDTHLAVLNKFPVVRHHLLLVTRRFVEQQALLDHDDFEALAACLAEYDALGFYNGGPEAGASQQHKHLQVVPLPLRPGDAVPTSTLFEPLRGASGVLRIPGFGFRHAFAWHEEGGSPSAQALLRAYDALIASVGIEGIAQDGVTCQSAPYNMLATREWMLIVPRSQPCCGDIPVNGLGYAGSVFVENGAQYDALRRMGPLAVLAAVAG